MTRSTAAVLAADGHSAAITGPRVNSAVASRPRSKLFNPTYQQSLITLGRPLQTNYKISAEIPLEHNRSNHQNTLFIHIKHKARKRRVRCSRAFPLYWIGQQTNDTTIGHKLQVVQLKRRF